MYNKTIINLPNSEEVWRLADEYLLIFKESFDIAPMEEKKQMLREWINKIEILEEADEKKARAFMY